MKQNTILYQYDENGKMINFERHAQKTAQGVINQYKRLSADCGGFGLGGWFLKQVTSAARIAIYKVNDHGEKIALLYSDSGKNFAREINFIKPLDK